jgi:hypothetical protein
LAGLRFAATVNRRVGRKWRGPADRGS